MAVDEANAAARFSAPLEKGRWNWSNRGSSMGRQPESPRKRKRAVTIDNWKLQDSMAPRNAVSKLVAIFPDIWTDPDSGGLEGIRS